MCTELSARAETKETRLYSGADPIALLQPPNGAFASLASTVLLASVGAALIGTALFAAIRRIVKHPMMIFGIVGGGVLLIASFVPYVMAPGGIAALSPTSCGAPLLRVDKRHHIIGRVAVDVEVVWIDAGEGRLLVAHELQHLPP